MLPHRVGADDGRQSAARSRGSDVGHGRVRRVHGEVVGAAIVMGDGASEPLSDVTAVESVRIEIDPRIQELMRMAYVPFR